jgi:hypothetical protein
MFVAAVLSGFQTWVSFALISVSFIVQPAAPGCSRGWVDWLSEGAFKT